MTSNLKWPIVTKLRETAGRSFNPNHKTLSNAGGIVSQRTFTAALQVGEVWLMSSAGSNVELASVFVVSENYCNGVTHP